MKRAGSLQTSKYSVTEDI